jgi:hypothetical protein
LIGKRFRVLVRLPWLIVQFWRALGAWERRDWPQVISLLQPLVTAGLYTSSDCTLVDIALAGEGRFNEALWHFEQIDPKDLYRFEEPFYANNYAYLLMRVGRLHEAQSLLRSFSRNGWPPVQQRWAENLLASAPPGDAPPREGLRLRRRLH